MTWSGCHGTGPGVDPLEYSSTVVKSTTPTTRARFRLPGVGRVTIRSTAAHQLDGMGHDVDHRLEHLDRTLRGARHVEEQGLPADSGDVSRQTAAGG